MPPPADRIGPYQILGKLGEGGMGEVYRARDTKLGRDVALKVLPDSFADDADRLARFEREAHVLASLNHANIAHIYGFEDDAPVRALVMELVDGPTLADRMATGRLPLDETLKIAGQIAAALEAAHQLGIVHRDLKPSNIKVKDDGTVKVLDFGLAKALEPVGAAAASVSQSPTLSLHATQAGIILGTAAYMAPEQARGKPADTRADIWAFGVVVFEMIAGRRPFDGDELSDTLASILKSEPNWPLLPAETPAALERLLRRCLQKDRDQRLQHIGDARLELADAAREQAADPPRRAAGGVARAARLAWGTAVVALAVVAAGVASRRPTTPPAPEMRLEVSTPDSLMTQFAVSIDGRTSVYAPGSRRPMQLRSLDTTGSRPLPGTEGGEYPFWSPDSRSIGFFANNKLRRVEIDGGQPQSLANVLTPAGGTWNRNGEILYVPVDSGGVYLVAATGGESREVTPPGTPPLATRLPQFLPDGRRFLFHLARGGEAPGVYVGELGSPTIRRILNIDRPAHYGLGHVWFPRDGALFAQRFDTSTLALEGPPIKIDDSVALGLFAFAFSVNDVGQVVYRRGGSQSRRPIAWYDRSGKLLGILPEQGGVPSNPSLSPDGRRLVMQKTIQENIDLWMVDLQRNVSTRLTESPAIDSMPVWGPDGNQIVYNGAPDGLVITRVDRTIDRQPLPLPSNDGVKIAVDWSADGRYLMYKQFAKEASTTDLWALPMAGDRTPVQLTSSIHDERDGQFSPDGRWVAYESDEAGSPEIYVQPFPGPGSKVRASANGGTQVRWRRDGKEIYYLDRDNSLMAASVAVSGGAIELGAPIALFKTIVAPMRSISRQQYVVSPDGQRFLIFTAEEEPMAPLTILLHWKASAR